MSIAARPERPYTQEDVERLRGSVVVEYTLARLGAERLRRLLAEEDWVAALGAMTGGQAVQMVKAGLKAIYLSGWQVAADSNVSGHTYPDQSLYPANSGPALARRINGALLRADQIAHAEGDDSTHWLAPIVADAEAGFGGPLNAFEIMKAYIEAGAAAVHFEDQLSSEKKCGHLGGKVLIPTSQFLRTLVAARLAADVADVPSLIVARTDALSATLLTSDIDEADREFCTGERTPEGFYRVQDGIEPAIARGLAYAPYADLVWFETSTPDLDEAERFAAVDARAVPRQAARVQLLALVQLATPPHATRRSQASSGASPRWATGSSSSPWPASTPSTFPCSSSPAAITTRRCRPTFAFRSANSSSRPRATRRPGTSARSAPATSTASWRRSQAAPPRRSHCGARPRRRQFEEERSAA